MLCRRCSTSSTRRARRRLKGSQAGEDLGSIQLQLLETRQPRHGAGVQGATDQPFAALHGEEGQRACAQETGAALEPSERHLPQAGAAATAQLAAAVALAR